MEICKRKKPEIWTRLWFCRNIPPTGKLGILTNINESVFIPWKHQKGIFSWMRRLQYMFLYIPASVSSARIAEI